MHTLSRARILLLAFAIALSAAVFVVSSTSQPSSVGAQVSCTYYVSTSGNDNSSGTSLDQAFARPNKAVSVAGPGDVVCIAGGTYNRGGDPYVLNIDNKRGTTTQPIVFTALDLEDRPLFRMNGHSDAGRGGAVTVKDSDNIDVIGIDTTFSMRGYYVNSSTNVAIQNCSSYNMGQEGIHVGHGPDQDQVPSVNVLIENCEVANLGNRVGSDGDLSFSNLGEGIYIGSGSGPRDPTNNITIRNNWIHDNSPAQSEAIDIKRGTSNITIEDNLIQNIDSWCEAAIRIHGDVTDVAIRRNVISNIVSTGTGGSGNQCTQAFGIRVSQLGGTGGSTVIENNVVWGAERAGICTNGVSSNTTVIIKNNTSYGNATDFESTGGVPCDGTAINTSNISSDGSWNTAQYSASDFVGPVTGQADSGTGCGPGSGFELINYSGEGAELDFCQVGITGISRGFSRVELSQSERSPISQQSSESNGTPESNYFVIGGQPEAINASDPTQQGDLTPNDDAVNAASSPVIMFLTDMFRVVVVGVGIVVTISVVVAGYQFMTSRGEPGKTKAAVNRITQAGLALLLYIFGASFLEWIIPGGVF